MTKETLSIYLMKLKIEVYYFVKYAFYVSSIIIIITTVFIIFV